MKRIALLADAHREAHRLPSRQGAQRRPGVDQVAAQQPRSRWRSGWPPTQTRRWRCRGSGGRSPRRRRSRGSARRRSTSTAASGSLGDAEHPGEVVAAATGNDPERRLRSGHRAADRPDQAVAAHHDRHLAGLRSRQQRLLDAVLKAAGALHPELDPARVQRRLHPRQQPQRPAPGRGGVDQQRQRHALDLHHEFSRSARRASQMDASLRAQPQPRWRRSAQPPSRRRPTKKLPSPASADSTCSIPWRASRRRSRAGVSRKGPARAARTGEDEVPAWAQNPRDLACGGPRVELGDEVEEVIGVGEGRGAADLEGDAPLGVEPDPGGRLADQRLRGDRRRAPGLAGNSRARNSAASPFPQPTTSTRSGSGGRAARRRPAA